MEKIGIFDFAPLHFTENGRPTNPSDLDAFVQAAANATDVMLLSHGFRNSEAEARNLYTDFFTNFGVHVQTLGLGSRKFLTGGVFWPSKSFREASDLGGTTEIGGRTQSVGDAGDEGAAEERAAAEAELIDLRETIACGEQKQNIDRAIELLDEIENSAEAQNEFVNLVMSVLDGTEVDDTEGLNEILAQDGTKVLQVLQEDVELPPTSGRATDEGGVSSVDMDFVGGDGSAQGIRDVVKSIFGGVGRLLNITTWYKMKERSGAVGAAGVADLVRKLRQTYPNLRIHLIGHSLGGRLMASCTKALGRPNAVTTLSLLEAAFSHYGFSETSDGKPGFFRDVLAKKVVRGPIVATYSALDEVVGVAYALASRVARDNVKALGDANDEFGGIGRNGTQNLPSSLREELHQSGTGYDLQNGLVLNLDGSRNLIKSHGDVTNPEVTWAVASVVASVS
jgi:hypothetical protein